MSIALTGAGPSGAGGPPPSAFVATINSGAGKSFALPLVNVAGYSFDVHWGDGLMDTITTWNQAETTHAYASNAHYQIWIYGAMPVWSFAGGGDCAKFLTLDQWGDTSLISLAGFAQGCVNLTSIATGGNFAGCTNADSGFRTCTALTAFPALSMPTITSFFATWDGNSVMATFGACDMSGATSVAFAWRDCGLTALPALNLSNVTNFGSWVSGCSALASILCTGFAEDFSVLNLPLPAAALNVIFGNLATVAKTITITGTTGAGTCDPTIATLKGWTVTN